MDDGDRGDGSLVTQAVAWVPPWARQSAVAVGSVVASPAAASIPEPMAESGAGDLLVADPPVERSVADPPVQRPVADPPVQRPVAEAVAVPVSDDSAVCLRSVLEAILLVVDEPVTESVLAQVVERPKAEVAGVLADLSAEYTHGRRGFDLRRVGGGWRLYTRPEYSQYVERFVLDGQHVRLTQAALETLAVIAYKQPVTRSRVSAIRGVNCDGVIRTLTTRGLVEACGTEQESGAFLYRTTTLFLEKIGVEGVDQLPPLAPFLPDDVEEITDAQC